MSDTRREHVFDKKFVSLWRTCSSNRIVLTDPNGLQCSSCAGKSSIVLFSTDRAPRSEWTQYYATNDVASFITSSNTHDNDGARQSD